LTALEVRQTEVFARWFAQLRDRRVRARILVRIRRASLGNLGDVRSVGGGVVELRVEYGPGYRIYCTRLGDAALVLLSTGDKRTQARDIERARRLARDLREE
jgi:putative addiction module killer protein